MHIDKTLIIPLLAMFMLAAMAFSSQSLAVGGDVLMPGLSTAAAGNSPLCFSDRTGQLGPCAPGIVVAPPCVDPDNRFMDCGDGTVFDKTTGLMWEKKEDCGTGGGDVDFSNPHCRGNPYTWSATAPPEAPSGTLFSDFLEKLNDLKAPNDGTATPCFAGYCDWRIPTIGELRSILLAPNPNCPSSPCIDSIFGPTPAASYWSSSSLPIGTSGAWGVFFSDGSVFSFVKSFELRARAVRSGR